MKLTAFNGITWVAAIALTLNQLMAASDAKSIYIVGQRDFEDDRAFATSYAPAIDRVMMQQNPSEPLDFLVGAADGLDKKAIHYIASQPSSAAAVRMFSIPAKGDNTEVLLNEFGRYGRRVSLDDQSFSSFGMRDQGLFGASSDVIAFLKGKYAFKSTTCSAIISQAIRDFLRQTQPGSMQPVTESFVQYFNEKIRDMLPRIPNLSINEYVYSFTSQFETAVSQFAEYESEQVKLEAMEFVINRLIESIYQDEEGNFMRHLLREFVGEQLQPRLLDMFHSFWKQQSKVLQWKVY